MSKITAHSKCSDNLYLRHLSHQICHFTPSFEGFCARQETELDVLDMPRFDMVAFYLVFRRLVCENILLQANSKVLEPMDQRNLHQHSTCLFGHNYLQHCIRYFDRDLTSTHHMEFANFSEEKNWNFCNLSCWGFVSRGH